MRILNHPTMPSIEEEKAFVDRSFREIQPLLDKKEQGLDPEDPANAEVFLERYRNKLFFEETGSSDPNAQRLLITGTDPGAYNAISPLIKALEEDPRCKGIGALVSGLARKNLESEFKDRLKEVKSDDPTLLQEVMEFSEREPFDTVVATSSALNGSETVALYGGKRNLGAKKLFLIAEGWGGLGNQFTSGQ
jgi:hypothetical protein